MAVKDHYVKMREVRLGGDDDDLNKVNVYARGKSYWMGESLYKVFIREGWADDAEPPKNEIETRAEEGAPENKSKAGAPENKSRKKK